jgi:hypothetical protein
LIFSGSDQTFRHLMRIEIKPASKHHSAAASAAKPGGPDPLQCSRSGQRLGSITPKSSL